MARNNPVLLTGPTRGLDGRSVLAKARAPLITDGRIGDFWIDTVSKKLYGPKNAGEWPDNGLIRGAQGWAPKLVAEADGVRRVFKIDDWTGGERCETGHGLSRRRWDGCADIGDAADFRGEPGPEALIDALDVKTGAVTYETLTALAESSSDNEKAAIKRLFEPGGTMPFRVKSEAQASTIPAAVTRTLIDGVKYRRASGEPAHAFKYRSTDRWTDEGNSDSANGGWWEIDEQEVTPAMAGAAAGDGNNTIPVLNALAYVFSKNATLLVDVPVYVTKLVIPGGTGKIRCTGSGEFRPHASADQSDIYSSDLLEFGADVTGSDFEIKIDMLGMSKSGMRIRGDYNTVTSFRCKNIQGATGRTKNIWGLGINGHKNSVLFARTDDCKNVSGQVVGCSTVIIDGYGEDNTIEWVEAYGGASAYLGNGKRNRIGTTIVDGTDDNGIYVIVDSEDYDHGTLMANRCTDELAVFSGDKRSYLHKVSARNCARGIGVQDTDTLRIGKISWFVDDPAMSSGSPLYIRGSNTGQMNSLEIDELDVRGIWRSGAPIWTLDDADGQFDTLSIGRIRARLIWNDATGTSTKTLAFTGSLIKRLVIGELDIEVVDALGTLTSSDVFRFFLPSALTEESSIGSIVLSNGGGAHLVRVLNVAQDVLKIGGIPTLRGDLAPPFVPDTSAQGTRTFGSGAAPTQGKWKRGDIVYNQFPSASGFIGWVCTASGTPGTWKTFGTISA